MAASQASGKQCIAHIIHAPRELEGSWALDPLRKSNIQVPSRHRCSDFAGTGNIISYTYHLHSWRVVWFMGAGSTTEVELEPPFKLPQEIDVVTSLELGTQSIMRITHIAGELDDYGRWICHGS